MMFGYWRDTHLCIYGDAVRYMQTRFILDWNQASRNDIGYEDRYYIGASGGDVGIQIVSSGPDSDWEQIKYGYIKMILSRSEERRVGKEGRHGWMQSRKIRQLRKGQRTDDRGSRMSNSM